MIYCCSIIVYGSVLLFCVEFWPERFKKKKKKREKKKKKEKKKIKKILIMESKMRSRGNPLTIDFSLCDFS